MPAPAPNLTPIRSAAETAKYVAKAVAEYAADQGRAPSAWVGRGADELNLGGSVDSAVLAHLFEGRSPDGASTLVQRPGKCMTRKGKVREGKFGWEIICPAPKSASILGQFDERIVDAVFRVSLRVATEVDRRLMVSDQRAGKRGRAGLKRASGGVVAVFLHGHGRPTHDGAAPDPHLHTHLEIPNLAWDAARGKWFTIAAERIFADQKSVNAYFLAELAIEMRRLGYNLYRGNHSWQIEGVSQALLDHFSSRSKSRAAEIAAREQVALLEKVETRRESELAQRLEGAGWRLRECEVSGWHTRVDTEEKGATRRGKEARKREYTRKGWIAELRGGRRVVDITGHAAGAGQLAKLDESERALIERLRAEIWADPRYEDVALDRGEKAEIRNRSFSRARIDKVAGADQSFRERLLEPGISNEDRVRLFATIEAARKTPDRDPIEADLEPTPIPPQYYNWGVALERFEAEKAFERDAAARNLVVAAWRFVDWQERCRRALEVSPLWVPEEVRSLGSLAYQLCELAESCLARQPSTPKQSESDIATTLSTHIEAWSAAFPLPRLGEFRRADQPPKAPPKETTLNATIKFVLDHLFERASVYTLADIADAVVEKAPGIATIEAITARLAVNPDVILANSVRGLDEHADLRRRRSDAAGGPYVTLRSILEEEHLLLHRLNCGRNQCKAIGLSADPEIGARLEQLDWQDEIAQRQYGPERSHERRDAVLGIINARDRYVSLDGYAGTGKTTVLHIVRDNAAKKGLHVVACAPTGRAARVVLREVFPEAETIAKVLASPDELHVGHDTLLVVDEGGLASGADLNRLMDLAEKRSARVLFVGDPNQHTSVNRTDGLRLLIAGGMATFTLGERSIIRQKNEEHRRVIQQLSTGDFRGGMNALMKLGAVEQIADPAARYSRVGELYVKAVTSAEKDKKTSGDALVVCATKREVELANAAVRGALAEAGLLDRAQKLELRQMRPSGMTTAQKRDRTCYSLGQVVEFHQRAGRLWRRGDRWVVVRTEPDTTLIKRVTDGAVRELPVAHAEHYSVFDSERIEIGVGERLLWRGSATDITGKPIRNGEVSRVTRVDAERRRITLDTGAEVGMAEYEPVSYGYALTSQLSQSATADVLIAAVDARSGAGAGTVQQALVTLSRGSRDIRLVTDSFAKLVENSAKSAWRLGALEMLALADDDKIRQLAAPSFRESWLGRGWNETLDQGRCLVEAGERMKPIHEIQHENDFSNGP